MQREENVNQKVAQKLGHPNALFTWQLLPSLYKLDTLMGPFRITSPLAIAHITDIREDQLTLCLLGSSFGADGFARGTTLCVPKFKLKAKENLNFLWFLTLHLCVKFKGKLSSIQYKGFRKWCTWLTIHVVNVWSYKCLSGCISTS